MRAAAALLPEQQQALVDAIECINKRAALLPIPRARHAHAPAVVSIEHGRIDSVEVRVLLVGLPKIMDTLISSRLITRNSAFLLTIDLVSNGFLGKRWKLRQ